MFPPHKRVYVLGFRVLGFAVYGLRERVEDLLRLEQSLGFRV